MVRKKQYYFNHKPLEKCIICGNDFIKEENNQKVCSEKCKKLLNKQQWHKFYENKQNY